MEPLEPRRMLAVWLPRPDHIVVVWEENRDYGDIFSADAASDAPYLRRLARYGTNFTKAHASEEGSLPNYVAMFSGSNQGLGPYDEPTGQFSAPSLAGQLRAKGFTFLGYAEDLPRVGFTGQSSGNYVRRHNPWVQFADVPSWANRPFTDFPQTAAGFPRLPTVAFVVPSLGHDMEDGSVRAGDNWFRDNVGAYAAWAHNHNSLLIVTWDEGRTGNRIPTIFYGAHVRHGKDRERLNPYKLLRTIENMYGLAPLGLAANHGPVTRVFMQPASVALTPLAATKRLAEELFSQTAIMA